MLRAKVINGGVLVNRRPPHPVEVKWTRTWRDRAARRGKQKQRQKNPKANVALLIAAQEARDETRDLFSNPQEHPECLARLAPAIHHGQVSEFDEMEAGEIESEQLFSHSAMRTRGQSQRGRVGRR